MKTIAIVGGSVAGVRSAEALRGAGFDGRLVLVGDDVHRPYDRPPLSKAFLEGGADEDTLGLLDADEEADLALEMRLGATATRLDAAGGRVVLADGTDVAADGVVIATGGRARRLPGTADVEGVHALRTLDDARALRRALREGSPRVVIVGAGFIGAEVASTCRAMGLEVTVLDGLPLPLAPVLGERIARGCVDLHAAHGTELLPSTAVAGLATVPAGEGRRVVGVELGDGSTVKADVVVVGIGITPNTEWLEGSGLRLENGVCTDAGMVTDLPNVVAVGDVARAAGRRHEHWTSAGEQATVAASNLLGGATGTTVRPSGYVWSEQYGRMLQLAGHPSAHDDVEIVDGAPDEGRFVARYTDGAGTTTGVFAMGNPRLFGRLRRTELPRAAS
ncbi:pyridine nucleotide-disulfide oxidoreductase [Actinomycetospora sp. NBRC 106375]|uniref:NAD(P)/FAD-dependent oxidoreductase n=1 Tax=Actinomycetospora sp. NBRC 106375 TaxID=3032207 RepID=UPI0024A2AB5B|nr:FAD-dependent oxidoreductase [Actinomycetospora sp. NBRC 106375]GLZ48816.1 pyridine nucleotide-disulfide oxidoreductase [Actinomycetospora sp. NBRC 106375]